MATSGLYGSSPTGAVISAPGSESAGLYGNGTTFGGSYFEWFIFIQADTQPATPTGGSWSFSTNSGTPPTGWSSTPPAAPTLPVWVSIALVNSKNASTLEWSAPGVFSYSSGLPILSGTGSPTSGDGLNNQLWIQTGTTPETIWFKQAGTWTRLTGSTLYVDTTSNQTIAGTKTFSDVIVGSVSGTSNNVTGIVSITNGGTGASTANGGLSNLGGIGTITSTDGTITVTTDGTSRDLSAAATNNVIAQVRNATGATLTKGTVVYISGATGQLPTVSKALATSDATSAQTLGMITADLPNNSNGNVTVIGLITNVDTSAYTDGQQLYLSGTTAGAVTATKPYAPIHLVYVAVVEHAHPTQGKLFVKVQNGYELDEIHNVSAQTPTNGQTIVWNSATSLWQNNTVSLTLGVNGTLPVANGGTGVTTSTGTGSTVLSISPSLVTPALGTPASGNFSTGTFTWPTFNQNTTGTASNVTGTVAIANGGTGQTTANGAFNALAPSQVGQSGKYLTTDGTNTSWATNPLGTVTSVAATVPSFLSISGSPITTSGTLAFGLSGTALPTTSGGTGLTSFTANGIVYASSTSALATGSALQFDGTNLGLGIAPASWDSAFVALDGGASTPSNGNGTLFFQKNGGYTTALGSNVYYNAGWKYRTTAASGRYEINNNSFAWYTAPSGTAGSAIMFTQAMTLNSDGSFLVGCTGLTGDAPNALGSTYQQDNGNTKIRVAADLQAAFQFYSVTGGTTAPVGNIAVNSSSVSYFTSATNSGFVGLDANTLGFITNGSERARIDTSGNFGIGTNSPSSALYVKRISGNSGIYTDYNGTNVGRIEAASNGNLYIGLTTGSGGVSIGNTANANALVLDSAGNFGVNTSSPNGRMTVIGNTVDIRNSSGAYGSGYALEISTNASQPRIDLIENSVYTGLIKSNGGIVILQNSSNNALTFGTNSTERARIDASGKFLIGISSAITAGGLLEVQTQGGTINAIDILGASGTSGMSGSIGSFADNLYIASNWYYSGGQYKRVSGNGVANIVLGTGSTDANTFIGFGTGNTATTQPVERARINSIGDFGVGTTSPTNFQQYGYGPTIETRGGNGGSFLVSNSDASAKGVLTQYSSQGHTYLKSLTNHSLIFGTYDIERVRIDTSGNLGLGTSAPAFRLDTATNGAVISGTATIGSNMYGMRLSNSTTATTNNAVGLWFSTGPHQAGIASFRPAADSGWETALAFYTHPTTTGGLDNCYEAMRIDGSGNLYVRGNNYYLGTSANNTNCTMQLYGSDASGQGSWIEGKGGTGASNAWFIGSYSVPLGGANYNTFLVRAGSSGGVYVSPGATSWTSVSDETRKIIIEPIIDAATKVSTLRTVIGRLKTDDESVRRPYLIAQDVQAVLPEAVIQTQDEEGQVLGLSYTEVMPLLVAAIKEQQEVIIQLKARLDAANL